MEEFEPAKPILQAENMTPKLPNEKAETRNYKLTLDKENFSLLIETDTNGSICFKVKQLDNISLSYFTKSYSYEDIIHKLVLFKDYYDSLSKVLTFIDTSIAQNKMILKKDKDNNIKLSLKKVIDYQELECIIDLEEKKLKNDEVVKLLFDEVKELKSKNIGGSNDKELINTIKQLKEEIELNKKEKEEMKKNIDLLSKQKDEMEKKIFLLKEENIKIKENFVKFKNYIEEKMKGQKNGDINLFTEINYDNFTQNPNNLKFKELLTNVHTRQGMLSNFAVYTGLKDKIPYLVYNNKTNFNLEVMRLNDNIVMHSLKKHNNDVTVIKYYRKEYNEEYLLSCDVNKLVIIWDIQNNFNIKNTIQEEFKGKIWDAHLLLNLSSKDFILLSSGEKGEGIKLYELKDNSTQFIKIIDGTKENITNYMIKWTYNNKYYIIKLYNEISIHNIFENELYTKLIAPKSRYYCGFIYKNNYLCANDRNNNLLRIWDLANKKIINEIKYDGEMGREIIQWNDIYTIVSCNHGFIVIDLEKGKVTNKIIVEKSCLGGVKKIYLDRLGECLIISDFNYNIELFGL